MPKLNIHSPTLRTALERFGPRRIYSYTAEGFAARIYQYTATLDQISDDIRALEKYLLQSGVRVEAEVIISEGGVDLTPPGGLVRVEEVRAVKTVSAVTWAPTPKGDPWRIYYREYKRHGTGETGTLVWGPPNELHTWPLIEAPVEVRLRVAESGALVTLVQAVADRMPGYDAGDVPIDGEVRLVQHHDGPAPDGIHDGWKLIFLPAGATEEGRRVKVYSVDHREELENDLVSLSSREVNEKMGPDWEYRGFRVRCTVSFRALRRLEFG
jgi:hypothetical protein